MGAPEGIDYSSQRGAGGRQTLAAITICHQNGGCRDIYRLCLLSTEQHKGSGDISGSGLTQAGVQILTVLRQLARPLRSLIYSSVKWGWEELRIPPSMILRNDCDR